MPAEEGRPAEFVGPERRLVVVHPDFLQDDELLGLEILVAECGPHHPRHEIHRFVLLLRQHRRVVDGVFLAGERIDARAHVVEAAVDRVARDLGGALEVHVLEEVARSPEGV